MFNKITNKDLSPQSIAVDQKDDHTYMMRKSPISTQQISYLSDLVARASGNLRFRTGSGRILRDLLIHWPTLDGWEDEAQELCEAITTAVYPLAGALFARAVEIDINISSFPMVPSSLSDRPATFVAFDIDSGFEKHCFISPNHVSPAQADLEVQAGVLIACEPLYYHYHQIKEDRENRLAPSVGIFEQPEWLIQQMLGNPDFVPHEIEILYSLNNSLKAIFSLPLSAEAIIALKRESNKSAHNSHQDLTALNDENLPLAMRPVESRLMNYAVDREVSTSFRLGMRRLTQAIYIAYAEAIRQDVAQYEVQHFQTYIHIKNRHHVLFREGDNNTNEQQSVIISSLMPEETMTVTPSPVILAIQDQSPIEAIKVPQMDAPDPSVILATDDAPRELLRFTEEQKPIVAPVQTFKDVIPLYLSEINLPQQFVTIQQSLQLSSSIPIVASKSSIDIENQQNNATSQKKLPLNSYDDTIISEIRSSSLGEMNTQPIPLPQTMAEPRLMINVIEPKPNDSFAISDKSRQAFSPQLLEKEKTEKPIIAEASGSMTTQNIETKSAQSSYKETIKFEKADPDILVKKTVSSMPAKPQSIVKTIEPQPIISSAVTGIPQQESLSRHLDIEKIGTSSISESNTSITLDAISTQRPKSSHKGINNISGAEPHIVIKKSISMPTLTQEKTFLDKSQEHLTMSPIEVAFPKDRLSKITHMFEKVLPHNQFGITRQIIYSPAQQTPWASLDVPSAAILRASILASSSLTSVSHHLTLSSTKNILSAHPISLSDRSKKSSTAPIAATFLQHAVPLKTLWHFPTPSPSPSMNVKSSDTNK